MLGDTGTPEQKAERRSYEFSGKLPVISGRARVAGQLIEAPFNFEQFATGENGQDPADIYSLVEAFCVGPVDKLLRFYINGKPVLWQNIERGAEDFLIINDTEWGKDEERGFYAKFFWGNEDQAAESFLRGASFNYQYTQSFRSFGNTRINQDRIKDLSAAPNFHPRYPGICYCVFFNIDTAYPEDPRSRGSALPTIEVEVYRKPKTISVSTDSEIWGVSPISLTHEALANKWWGAGMESILDLPSWQSEAQEIELNGFHILPPGQTGINVAAASKKRVDQFLSDVSRYYDGFFRLQNGKLVPGHFPNKGQTPVGSVPELTIHDMLTFPEINPPESDEIVTQVAVKFSDMTEYLEDVEVTERSPVNVMETGSQKSKSIDAPHLIRYNPARAMGKRSLSRSATTLGKFTTFEMGLFPGDLFHYSDDYTSTTTLFRVIKRKKIDALSVLLEAMQEPGTSSDDYEENEDPRLLPPEPTADDFIHYKVLEIPPAMGTRVWPPEFILLAQRENLAIYQARVYASDTGSFTGEERRLDNLIRFAARGTLNSAVDAIATSIQFTLDKKEGHPSGSFSSNERDMDEGLLLVGSELISLSQQSAKVDNLYSYSCLRGRLGTASASHASGEEVWFFHKSNIQIYEMEYNGAFTPENYTLHLRLMPITSMELGNATPSFQLISGGPQIAPPVIAFDTSAPALYWQARITWDPAEHDPEDHIPITLWKDGDYNGTKKMVWAKASEGTLTVDLSWTGTTHAIAQTVTTYRGVSVWGNSQSAQITTTVNDFPAPGPVTSLFVSYSLNQRVNSSWNDPDPVGGLANVEVWGRRQDLGAWTFLASLGPGIESFTWDPVIQDSVSRIWEVKLIPVGSTGRKGTLATKSATAPALATVQPDSPLTACLSVPSTKYYGYKYTWDPAGLTADDWVLLQRWPASGTADVVNEALGDIKWIRANLGTFEETVEWEGWIGARAWLAKRLKGTLVYSAVNTTEWAELNMFPAPTGLQYQILLSLSGGRIDSDESNVSMVIPASQVKDTTKIQVFSNVDVEDPATPDTLEAEEADMRFASRIDLSNDTWNGAYSGDTWPSVYARYIKADGKKSAWAQVQWTVPSSNGFYTFT